MLASTIMVDNNIYNQRIFYWLAFFNWEITPGCCRAFTPTRTNAMPNFLAHAHYWMVGIYAAHTGSTIFWKVARLRCHLNRARWPTPGLLSASRSLPLLSLYRLIDTSRWRFWTQIIYQSSFQHLSSAAAWSFVVGLAGPLPVGNSAALVYHKNGLKSIIYHVWALKLSLDHHYWEFAD